MTLDHKVCTFVVNFICRKFFLDERPTISLKHYFFSCVSVVFMSDSDDYSYIESSSFQCYIVSIGSYLLLI